MSYDSQMAAGYGKRAVFLYEFTREGVTSRFVRAPREYVDSDAVTWAPKPIIHGEIVQTGVAGRAETPIIFPLSDPFADDFHGDLSYERNSVAIFHEVPGETPPARATFFRGRVTGTRPMALARLALLAENNFTVTRRKGLSRVMQRPCAHALYHSRAGYGCNLDIADFQTGGTLTGLADLVATVPAAAAEADAFYAGGVLEWSGRRQLIMSKTGADLTLIGPIAGLEDAFATSGSEAVLLAPGCDLTRATCNDTFGNLLNHGGWDWMRGSPFDGRLPV